MTQAKENDTVKIHYTCKVTDGEVFESTHGKNPLQFTLGKDDILPEIVQAIIGMEPGESKTFDVSSEQAYGPHQPEMILEMPRNQLPDDLPMDIGQRLEFQRKAGGTQILTVVDANEETITFDGNHPLAGKDLTFQIELIEVT